MIRRGLRAVIVSVGMVGTVFLISGCNHNADSAASAAAPAPITDPRMQQISAQHTAAAAFDAKNRAATMARMHAAGAK